MAKGITPITHTEKVVAGEVSPITHLEKVIAEYGGGGGGFTPTQSQLNAMNSGITEERVEQITTNESNISLKANTSDVNAATASLQAQINQIAQAAGTGSADTEVAQARVDADGTSYQTLKARLDAENEVIIDEIGDIKTLNSEEAIEFTETVNVIKENDGVLSEISTQNYFHTYIAVNSGEKYSIKTYVGISNSYPYYIYAIVSTADKTVVERYAPKESSAAAYNTYVITVPSGATTLAIMRYKSNDKYINITKMISEIVPLQSQITAHEKYMPIKIDLHDPLTDTSGLINENGVIAISQSYTTTDFIATKQGYTYTISDHCRRFVAFNPDKEVIIGSYDSSDYVNDPKLYNALQNGYIRFSFVNTESPSVSETFSGTPTLKCSEGVLLSETQKKQVEQNIYNQDVLYGKKWVVVGDSFSNGGTYDDIIDSGLYKGKRALYQYLIGNRHLMNIVHFATGGRTLTTPETILSHNCFSDTDSNYNYTDVPTDADYITIWLGINDSKTESGETSVGETPLGTIDDTTVHTFYGAWNVVLEYLLEHNPYAHIGIIVSNGCTGTNYPNAIKAVARKWGIAYLDLNNDYTIPLMHRVNGKSEVCERAIELRKSAFWVSPTNGHPNAHAQAYQSTFIENWLKTL